MIYPKNDLFGVAPDRRSNSKEWNELGDKFKEVQIMDSE